jgi:hypothetical protein
MAQGTSSAAGARALALCSLFVGTAAADPPPAAPQTPHAATAAGKTELETVTITAAQRKQLERQISKFVSSITLPARDESLARWQEPICPLVAGMSREGGEFTLARLSQAARDAGAPLGSEKCDPNFLIVLTPEPEELLKKWWRRHPGSFNDERGIAGIKHFVHTSRPVRIWYNATSRCPGAPTTFVMQGGTMYPGCVDGGLGSKLSWETVRKIISVIVVVDTKLVKDLNAGQLADYISMIGMAQIRENPKLGDVPTILRLFEPSGAARPAGLSRWDQEFLKSLYATDTTKVMQIAEIKFHMDAALAP